jgi:hypothetical protein
VAADRTTGGDGKSFPFFKDKAAVFAGCRGNLKMEARPWGPGEVVQVIQDLLFGEGEELGDFQSGMGLLQEQLFDSLAGGGGGFPG